MDHQLDSNQTISSSKDESILKALAMAQDEINQVLHPVIHRPEIDVKKILLRSILWMIPIVMVYIGLSIFISSRVHCLFIALAVTVLISLIHSKKIVTELVLMYQRFAPESLRAACVFTPTCSEYMLLAIEKYGVFRGVAKGIGRLLRCHYPNGGTDYP